MVHVPAETMVTMLPETVHTAGVCDESVTSSDEVAAALAGNGASWYVIAAGAAIGPMV